MKKIIIIACHKCDMDFFLKRGSYLLQSLHFIALCVYAIYYVSTVCGIKIVSNGTHAFVLQK